MYTTSLIKLFYLCFIVIQEIINARSECLPPPQPSFGRLSILNNKSRLIPGMVSEYTVLRIECEETYLVEGCIITLCLNGSWTPDIGHCSKICPPIYSNSILTVKCIANGKETINCTDALDGTIAHFRCASFYEDSRLARPTAVCTAGKWSESVPDCRPVCGKISKTRHPALIVGGRVSKKRQFPWQAALYHSVNQSLLCGGTLLNERVILTGKFFTV
jgi:hypothetical protein